MKYFTLTLFLLLTVVLNAQLNMEEISYVPSPSGYYNNLVVKGNVNIAEMVTYPFNVQSYGSFLHVKVNPSSTSKLYIGQLNVSNGTVALFSEFTVAQNNSWSINVPNQPAQREALNYIPITMNGGNLSVSKSNATDSPLNISALTFNLPMAETPTMKIRTKDLQYAVKDKDEIIMPFETQELYILGMKVPRCTGEGGGYYWQPVKVGSIFYNILACNTTGCNNPEYEEACLQRNNDSVGWDRYVWDTTDPNNCYCKDNTQGTQINIPKPDDY